MRTFALIIMAATLLVTGCDDGSTPNTTPDVDFSENCQDYVQGIAATTDDGSYAVTIMDSSQAPPDKGINDLTLRVVDADGNAVDSGITLVVEPWMPAHGHGSTNITATPRGSDGEYDAPGVNLIMPGAWELRMLITDDADTATVHKAVFTFCAEG